MQFFHHKSLLSSVNFAWKTLVVLILSVLLFVPTPALALDYNATLQTYVSNTKVELDGVLTSIKKLSSLSYENGKTTLAEIDSKLHKIQTDAGNNAKEFKKLSDKAQIEYEQILTQINQQDTSMRLTLLANQETNLPSLTNNLNNPVSVNISATGQWNYGTQIPFNRLVNANGNPGSAGRFQSSLRFPNISPAVLVTVKNNTVLGSGMQHSFNLLPNETASFINNDAGGNYGDNSGSQTINYSVSSRINEKDYFFSKNGNKVTIQYSVKNLDSEKQRLANGIVLTNKISKLCDDLEKRVNLAKQKAGNVKEYADALRSFSDPDILSEIAELDQLVADLTKNLLLG
ncbi:MAG: hypothetical protein VKL59_02355 [Nostocaceae cyanobacterium]|nr:hypothetical protein [Nostocaceae cyanobacterium]